MPRVARVDQLWQGQMRSAAEKVPPNEESYAKHLSALAKAR